MGDKRYDDEDLRRLAEVIGEQIVSQFKTALESIDEIKRQVSKIPAIEQKVDDLSDDMQAVKAALRATNIDMRSHEQRLSHLESAVNHA